MRILDFLSARRARTPDPRFERHCQKLLERYEVPLYRWLGHRGAQIAERSRHCDPDDLIAALGDAILSTLACSCATCHQFREMIATEHEHLQAGGLAQALARLEAPEPAVTDLRDPFLRITLDPATGQIKSLACNLSGASILPLLEQAITNLEDLKEETD